VWDNPRLANVAANALYAIALALIVYAGARVLFESSAFSLKTIVVGGELQHVARDEIVRALQGRVKGTFFTVDLETVRALFEGIPWVRRAELRRDWPDRLEVRIEEHVALARWRQSLAARPSVKSAVSADYPALLRDFIERRKSWLSGLQARAAA